MRKIANKNGPTVLRFTSENIQHKFDVLRKNLKLTDKDVCSIVEKRPLILHLSADNNIAPTILFLAQTLDLGKEDLRKLIRKEPTILSLNTATLQSKMNFFLDDLQLSPLELRKMLLGIQKLMTYSLQSIKGTLVLLHELFSFADQQLIMSLIHI